MLKKEADTDVHAHAVWYRIYLLQDSGAKGGEVGSCFFL